MITRAGNATHAIVVLGAGALAVARKIQALYTGARIHGLRQRVSGADIDYDDFGATLRDLYRAGMPIIALCSAGIVIRTLAPLLNDKGAEPPVLAVAEDGSAVVPLLGGVSGVNVMAREIATGLGVAPAITTSGELRFGTCLLQPPEGYRLADLEQGKRFVADLLGGESVRIDGDAPWLDAAELPRADDAQRTVRISSRTTQAPGELLIHPRTLIAAIRLVDGDTIAQLERALALAALSPLALSCVVAPLHAMGDAALQHVARHFAAPLRFVDDIDAFPPDDSLIVSVTNTVALYETKTPVDPLGIGQARGSVTVVGLGPGSRELMVPAARDALAQADDILGYTTYVDMAGPFRAQQRVHGSDNREELQRARHAFELAASGRRVVVVSSGDPGVFAMAAAVLEALEQASENTAWQAVELNIFPGVSAALATAARAGAPLGHDFCMISLSDNLKPWAVIESRLEHAAAADFVLAFYNPISKARPSQLAKALEIVARHRAGDTLVVLGRDIGRPGEALITTTLAQLESAQVDSRTLVIVGSSTTRRFARADGGEWVYTPRWYPTAPE